MESEPSNQVAVPKSIMRKVKVYAAQNDLKLKEVVASALLHYVENEGFKQANYDGDSGE